MPTPDDLYNYFEYSKEATTSSQVFYAPFFANQKKVLDIACGRGEFLSLMRNNGISVVGVDADESSCQRNLDEGFDVARSDVFKYLESLKTGDFDGLFMSHFLEHLTYPDITRIFELCFGVLPADGILVGVVPSMSSIGMHLEWFYRDPTHVGFRHLKTLEFLLIQAGFEIVESGDNPRALVPYLAEENARLTDVLERLRTENTAVKDRIESGNQAASAYGSNGFKRLISRVAGRIVRPFIDEALETSKRDAVALHATQALLIADIETQLALINKVDRSFEEYFVARKTGKGS